MYIVLINSEINDYWWLTLVVFKRKLQSMPKNMILVTGRNWKRYIPAQSNRLSIKIAVISLEKLELYLPVNVLMITSLESNKSQLSKFQNAHALLTIVKHFLINVNIFQSAEKIRQTEALRNQVVQSHHFSTLKVCGAWINVSKTASNWPCFSLSIL